MRGRGGDGANNTRSKPRRAPPNQSANRGGCGGGGDGANNSRSEPRRRAPPNHSSYRGRGGGGPHHSRSKPRGGGNQLSQDVRLRGLQPLQRGDNRNGERQRDNASLQRGGRGGGGRGTGRGRGGGGGGRGRGGQRGPPHISRQDICYCCGMQGHWSYDCPLRSDPLMGESCHRCGAIGHKSHKCCKPYNYNKWL